MKTKSQTAVEKILGKDGSFVGCTKGPSGSWTFHIWKVTAKVGDKCQCGERTLKK